MMMGVTAKLASLIMILFFCPTVKRRRPYIPDQSTN